jgi:hypothetical protein
MAMELISKDDNISATVLSVLTPWPESASELYRQKDRRLPVKLVPTSVDRGRLNHYATAPPPSGILL